MARSIRRWMWLLWRADAWRPEPPPESVLDQTSRGLVPRPGGRGAAKIADGPPERTAFANSAPVFNRHPRRLTKIAGTAPRFVIVRWVPLF